MSSTVSSRQVVGGSPVEPIQDLFVALLGAATSVLTAFLLAAVDRIFGIAIYSFVLWFIIPIGAILSGFAAASGYYFGAKWLNHRPTKVMLVSVVAVAVASFFLIHYLDYRFMAVNGRPVSEVLSFGGFLNVVLSHQSIEIGSGSHATSVALGFGSYIYAGLQMIGFAVGGFGIYGYLESLPFCERCSKYMVEVRQQERFSNDLQKLNEFEAAIKKLADGGRPQEAITMHASFGDAKPTDIRVALRSRIEIKRCTGCTRHWMGFTISKRGKNDWNDIAKTGFRSFTDQRLTTANVSYAAAGKP
jgi:hypothetical protein